MRRVSEGSAWARHEAAVARLRASYDAIPAGAPVRLAQLGVRDVTARKQAEEALARSEETLRLAQAAAGGCLLGLQNHILAPRREPRVRARLLPQPASSQAPL